MTHAEQRLYLLRALLAEDVQYRNIVIPEDARRQEELLRALMNLRPPRAAGEEFLAVQDAYLSAEREMAGVVDVRSLPPLRSDERLILWQGDITTLRADAVVNAANSGMRGCFRPLHGCIDNIIHTKSGIQLRLYCDALMNRQGHEESAGQAKITPGFNLPSRYILHTVGPVIGGRVTRRDRELLASCYRSCLELAGENGLENVVFCCISTGVFRFPNQEAAEIAVKTVTDCLRTPSSIQKVIFNVFKDADLQIYRGLLGADRAAETGS